MNLFGVLPGDTGKQKAKTNKQKNLAQNTTRLPTTPRSWVPSSVHAQKKDNTQYTTSYLTKKGEIRTPKSHSFILKNEANCYKGQK